MTKVSNVILTLLLVATLFVISSYDAQAVEIEHGFQNVTTTIFTTASQFFVDVPNAYLESGNFTAGHDYLIIVTAQFRGSDVADQYILVVRQDDSPTPIILQGSELRVEPASTDDWFTYTYFTRYTASCCDDILLSVRSHQESNFSVDQVTMVSLHLDDLASTDFFYNLNQTDFDLDLLANGVWSNANNATITFTPENEGDTWLVGTSSQINSVDLNDNTESGISVNGTDPITSGGTLISDEGEDTTEIDVLTIFQTFVLHSTEQTFAENFRNDEDNIGIRDNSQVFALRLNAFTDFTANFTNSPIDITGTLSKFHSDDLTMTTTGDALVLGQLIIEGTTDGAEPHIILQTGNSDSPDTQTSDNKQFSNLQDVTEELPFQIMNLTSLTGTNTFELDGNTDSDSGGDTVEDRLIVAFSMELKRPIFVIDLLDLFESESTTLGTGNSLCQNIDLETSSSECFSELEVGHTYRFEMTVRNDGDLDGLPVRFDLRSVVANFDVVGKISANQILSSGCSTNTDWIPSISSINIVNIFGTICTISSGGGTEIFWAIVRIGSDAGSGTNPTMQFFIQDAFTVTTDTSTTTTFNVNNVIGGNY